MLRSVRKGTVDGHMGAPRSARSNILVALVLAGLCGGLFATRDAHAQQQDAATQVQRYNKRAMADYDNLEFELARKSLMDAVALLRQAGIDETPAAAKTYFNLGLVYVAGFKDRNRGLQQFVQALKINPGLKLDPAVASPELEEVWAAARKQVGAGREPTTKDPGPKDPVDSDPSNNDVKGLQHNPLDEAKPGEPLTVKAQLGSDTGATKLYVLYRVSGQADYVAIPMKNAGSEWIAVIPGEVITDRPLQYYLEARDKKGRAVVGSGSAPNPYIVTLSESAPGARVVRRNDPQNTSDPKKYQRMFVNLMPGFGIGYHPGGNTTEVAWQLKTVNGATQYQRAAVDQPGGVAIAPFHLSVEIGGMITKHFSLSVLGRFEVVTGANAQTSSTDDGTAFRGGTTKAGGAVSGFIRARYRFLDGKFHPYIHVDLGGGEIRHALNLSAAQTMDKPLVDEATARTFNDDPASGANINKQLVCPGTGSCYDTLKLGLVFVGGGAGLTYDVWKYIAIMLDVNVLGAIGVGPGGQSGMNVDVQLGVGAHFL